MIRSAINQGSSLSPALFQGTHIQLVVKIDLISRRVWASTYRGCYLKGRMLCSLFNVLFRPSCSPTNVFLPQGQVLRRFGLLSQHRDWTPIEDQSITLRRDHLVQQGVTIRDQIVFSPRSVALDTVQDIPQSHQVRVCAHVNQAWLESSVRVLNDVEIALLEGRFETKDPASHCISRPRF